MQVSATTRDFRELKRFPQVEEWQEVASDWISVDGFIIFAVNSSYSGQSKSRENFKLRYLQFLGLPRDEIRVTLRESRSARRDSPLVRGW